MAKRKNQEAAAEAYATAGAAIETLMEALAEAVERHQQRQKEHPGNWGYPGDLGHVQELLADAVAFLGSSK